MSLYTNKPFWILGSIFVLGFTSLFLVRLGLIEKLFSRPRPLPIASITSSGDKENWMNIFQNNRKIGFSHAWFSAENAGYLLQETVHMRINTMGMVQDINLNTRGRLKPDFSLADFEFEINSGRFSFSVNGSVAGKVLKVETTSAGAQRKIDIPLKAKPYLLPAITAAVAAAELNSGDKYTFDIFDPATMGQTPVIVEVIGKEDLQITGGTETATKVALNFKGTSQLAWIAENGDILKEKGMLGIRLEKTTRANALRDLAGASSADLTQTASIPSNVTFENLERLSTLRVEIDGIANQRVQLHGGRQTFKDNILTIEKESTADLPDEIRVGELQSL